MKETKLKISEVFYSIQGEGFWVGHPAIFIRFSGCNLKCPWCDTDFSHKLTLTKEAILQIIKNYPCKLLVLTGGEPGLQIDEEFVQFFKDKNYQVHIESNGTVTLPKNLDWVTISPKEKWIIKGGDELKVVYVEQDLEHYNKTNFNYYYLQPCYTPGYTNYEETVQKVKEDNQWILSIQMHRILKIR